MTEPAPERVPSTDLDSIAIELLDIASGPADSHDKEQCFRLALLAAYSIGMADAHSDTIARCDEFVSVLSAFSRTVAALTQK